MTRIGLLKADYVNDDLVPIHGDLQDMFREFLSGTTKADLDVFEIRHGEWPSSIQCYDAIAISGSRFSVNDTDCWVRTLLEFIRVTHGEVPIIGFCFGHQAIAKALGGDVGPRKEPNVGAREVSMVSYPDWADPMAVPPVLLFNHSEQVHRCPPGAKTIAGDEICPAQIVQYSPSSLGIQAHPEYSKEYQDALMALNPGIDEVALAEARRRTEAATLAVRTAGTWVRNFIQLSKVALMQKEVA